MNKVHPTATEPPPTIPKLETGLFVMLSLDRGDHFKENCMKYGLVYTHNQNPGQCSEVAIPGISHYQRFD